MQLPENYHINEDIPVVCVTARSFPQGILAAHEALHRLLPPGNGRQYFGLSWPDQNGQIIYKAAATELEPGEAGDHPDRFLIRKGTYTSLFISNYADDTSQVGAAFRQLLQHPHIDPSGYCLEIYEGSRDIRCLAGLDASQQ
ncbi:MAG: hypothetical protein U0X40_10580 [Ferruginibacter sp.]